jgi:hypothetical protein
VVHGTEEAFIPRIGASFLFTDKDIAKVKYITTQYPLIKYQPIQQCLQTLDNRSRPLWLTLISRAKEKVQTICSLTHRKRQSRRAPSSNSIMEGITIERLGTMLNSEGHHTQHTQMKSSAAIDMWMGSAACHCYPGDRQMGYTCYGGKRTAGPLKNFPIGEHVIFYVINFIKKCQICDLTRHF